MWYHTDVNERILDAPGVERDGEEEEEDDGDGAEVSESLAINRKEKKHVCPTLQYLSMKAIVATRKDFFSAPSIPPTLKVPYSPITSAKCCSVKPLLFANSCNLC